MKKSLLALAAMGAFASVAQAQSSVTVYGVLDEGYAGGNNRTANGGAVNTNSGVVKVTGGGFVGGNQSTNRIGLRGSEDLGGGASAFFTYEAKMDMDSGSTTSLFSTTRQAFVGLKKNGIGAVALGTQNTAIYDAILASDPTGVNNVSGSLIHTSTVGAQGAPAYISGLSSDNSYVTRISNSLTFKSDKFAGFGARAMIVAASKTTTQTTTGGAGAGVGGQADVSGAGLGIDYTWQKLNLTANYQTFKASANTNAISTVPVLFGASAAGTGGSLNSLGTNVQDDGQYYAANYDFGVLKAYYQYLNRKATSVSAPTYYSKFTSQQIGVRSYVTPTIEAWAAASMGKYQNMATVSNTPYTPGQQNLTAMQLGANYWLSKRTNLYAIYGQMASSNAALTSATANTYSANTNNYAVGVRHTF